MYTVIKAYCVDQALQVASIPKLASGGENCTRIEVTFDEKWTGYGKVAVLYRNESHVYHVVMVDDACIIPRELLAEPGVLYFGILGTSGSITRPTEVVALTVERGAITGLAPFEPLPDVYKQVLSAYGAVESRLAAETAARKRDVAVERARIDNLAAGGTAGGSEVVDIRVSAEGTTYTSAGDAVREQVAALRKAQNNPNLVDANMLSYGYFDTAGAVSRVGEQNFCYYSDYIPVDNSLPYYWHVEHPLLYTDPWVGFCTYDTDKNFIERLSWFVSERSMKFNDDVAYVRVSFRSLMLGKAKFEQSTYPTLIDDDPTSENLAEVYPLVMPGYINAGGYINDQTPAGDSGISLAERFSRMLPVTAGETYVFYNGATYDPWAAVAFYTADGTPIERVPFTTDEGETFAVTAPEGAVAMRYSARTYSQHSFICYRQTGFNDYMDDYLRLMIDHRTKVELGQTLVKAVAHRGYSSGAPENTLPAYRLAKKNGFDCAECDVSFTSDGVAVLLHDDTIDRTSNGTGSIANMTFEQVRAFDFGSWRSGEYAGTKIPTVGEFLMLCRNIGLRPYIELKTGTEDQIKGLVGIVKQYGLIDETSWISFSATRLAYIKDVCAKARLGYVVEAVTADVITTAQGLQTGENEVFIDTANYADECVDLCVAAGLPMEVWTVNSVDALKALPAYVSGVTSDIQHAGKVLLEYSMG